MTLLVIAPDYASHVIPMLEIARRDARGDEPVIVATGPATDHVVRSAGFERVDLRLGRGSNPGVIRPEDQPVGEDDHLRAFFDATRRGMVATLRYQADARLHDLLYEPVAGARRTLELVEAVAPDRILVDHLAYSSTLGLRAAGMAYDDVVLGHPSALPVADEVYGELGDIPAALSADPAEVEALRAVCIEVRDRFTEAWNAATAVLAASVPPVHDAFAVHGDVVRYHYVADMHPPERTRALPPHRFLGPCIRDERLPDPLAERLAAGPDLPLVHVSFGSFLSARDDVLATVAEAIRSLGVRAAIATGSSDPDAIGPQPDGWIVAPHLPQVAVLRHASVSVTHGGNNSVMEAVDAAVPMVVLPFSTDQFAGAAAVERTGRGAALDPSTATSRDLASVIGGMLTDAPARV